MNNNKFEKFFKTKVSPIVGASILVLSLAGCPSKTFANTKKNTSYTSSKLDNYVDIPNYYKSFLYSYFGTTDIELKDLYAIKNLTIVASDEDLSWLNYCSSLRKMNMLLSRKDEKDLFLEIKNLKSLEEITLSPISSGYNFDEKSFSFLLNCPNLKSINLSGFEFIDEEFINKLDTVTDFTITLNSNINSFTVNSNIDFTKLKNLKKLKFVNVGLYNAAIYLDNDDLSKLNEKNVSVDFSGDFTIDELKKVNDELNDMVKDLNISSKMSEQDKFNSILEYVLLQLNYNQESLKLQESGENTNSINATMYIDGYLYAIFNKDSAICGNYAALFQALANRIGIKSYFMTSNVHAWNLVNINDEYYYVDSTRLDNLVVEVDNKKGMFIDFYQSGDERYKDVPWYMEQVLDAKRDDTAHSHVPNSFPSFLNIESGFNTSSCINNGVFNSVSSYDITDKKFLIGKKFFIDSETLICILLSFGLAKKLGNYSRKKK